jgi:hypothetical protein
MTDQSLQIGSSVVPLYVERRMKVYAVTEGEFATLSTLNAQQTIFFSVALALISGAVSIWANAVFYNDVPPAAYVAKMFVAPAGILLAIVFLVLAGLAVRSGRSTWRSIKTESISRASP